MESRDCLAPPSLCPGGGLRDEEVEVVERGDDFAADHDFLEISAIPERTVVQNALPERGDDVVRSWVDRRQSRIDHANRLSTGHASASAACGKGPRRRRGVANGTRTRNSQNHNLELYH